jgi:hypothetical protein
MTSADGAGEDGVCGAAAEAGAGSFGAAVSAPGAVADGFGAITGVGASAHAMGEPNNTMTHTSERQWFTDEIFIMLIISPNVMGRGTAIGDRQ